MEQLELGVVPLENTHKILSFQILVCGSEILTQTTETASGFEIPEVKQFLLIDKGVNTTFINIKYEYYKDWF